MPRESAVYRSVQGALRTRRSHFLQGFPYKFLRFGLKVDQHDGVGPVSWPREDIMMHTRPSRRARHGGIGLAIASICAGMVLLWQSPASGHRANHERINIGLQLYSLRTQLAKHVPDSLALVEKWGITDVETAGFYGMTARQFRQE